MNTFEQNVMHSFRLAKADIFKNRREIIETHENLLLIRGAIEELKSQHDMLDKQVRLLQLGQRPEQKTTVKTTKKSFTAPKTGSKFHQENCPFAQNIKPKNKITFTSKNIALNEGFKPCKCVA